MSSLISPRLYRIAATHLDFILPKRYPDVHTHKQYTCIKRLNKKGISSLLISNNFSDAGYQIEGDKSHSWDLTREALCYWVTSPAPITTSIDSCTKLQIFY